MPNDEVVEIEVCTCGEVWPVGTCDEYEVNGEWLRLCPSPTCEPVEAEA